MDILLVGVDPIVRKFLREHVPSKLSSKVAFHSLTARVRSIPTRAGWDLIVIGEPVEKDHEFVAGLKKGSIKGLKIVIASEKTLDSAVGFWGGDGVYSYLLNPISRPLWQFTWQNALERIEMSRKMSRLRQQRQPDRMLALEEQIILKDLFRAHLKIQEMEQARTQFLAHTAHELRSPLTALQGFLTLLTTEKAGSLSPLQRNVLQQSTHSLQRLLDLTGSLLELGSVGQQSASLRLERGDLRSRVERSVEALGDAARGKGITLSADYSPKLPPVCADLERLQIVFTNLLDNAVKFTPRGGTVRLVCEPHFWERRTIREKLAAREDRRKKDDANEFNSIRVVVEDTGPGIDPESLPHIFQEYFRGTDGNGGSQGFGLGLALSWQIIAAHAGKIWAESQPGQGSRFTVLVPTDLKE